MMFTQLENPDRKLFILMNTIFFGRLENLTIENGFANVTPESRKIVTANFDRDDVPHTGSRPDGDFILTEKHVRFLRKLRSVGNGLIYSITIQDGLPVRAEIMEGIATI